MDRLKVIETFVAVASKGSLTAAAKLEGVAPAVLGRRIDALEERLGVKLLTRTTRRITLTREGNAFLEDCQRILTDIANAEANVSAGSVRVSGSLRITAPAGFGRRHVAPLVPKFVASHPKLHVSLNLSDRVVDLPNEGFDCAVRVGDLPDSSLVAVRLADNRRLCVAAPAYLDRAGVPKHPSELAKHECLVLSSEASQTRGWAFVIDGELVHLRPSGRLDCSDGQVLHGWCLEGEGMAWRSAWEVHDDLLQGRLVSVLDAYAAPANGIYAVYAQRKHQPLRLRLWIEHLKSAWGSAAYWRDVTPPGADAGKPGRAAEGRKLAADDKANLGDEKRAAEEKRLTCGQEKKGGEEITGGEPKAINDGASQATRPGDEARVAHDKKVASTS